MSVALPTRSTPLRRIERSARLLDLEWRPLLRRFSLESFAFLGLCFYMFIEYVRPQSVWRSLDVLPWGQVALALPIIGMLFDKAKARPFILLDGLLILFTLILFASFTVAFDVSASFDQLKTFINWLIFYYLATRLVSTGPRFLLILLTFMLWSFKMSQFGARAFITRGFAFASWGIGGGPGWFHNSGELAIQMCIFLPISLHLVLGLRHRLPKWKTYALLAILPGTAFLTLIASSSRGGQLGAAAVLFFVVAQSKHRVKGIVWAAILLPALWFITPPQQKQRFYEMGDDKTSVSRLTYWKDGLGIMRDHPVLGIGFNNWLPYYHRYYNPIGEVPHNIFIQAGSELGYTGLLAVVALMAGTFVTNRRTRKLARGLGNWEPFYRSMALGLDAGVVGFVVPGFFVTVLYYPFFWVNLGFTGTLYLVVWRHRMAQRQEAARARKRPFGAPLGATTLQPTPLPALPAARTSAT